MNPLHMIVHIKCWNAYVESNAQEPQTGTQFQRWVALSSFRHDIKYSQAFNIFDAFTGKGAIPLRGTQPKQSKAVHYENNNPQRQYSHHHHHHHANTVATSRDICRSRAQTAHHNNHNNPQKPQKISNDAYGARNRAQSAHHSHHQTHSHTTADPAPFNGLQSRSQSYDTSNQTHNHSASVPYETNASHRPLQRYKAKSDGLYLIKSNQYPPPPPPQVQNIVFNEQQNAQILQPASCHIRAVSLDPKEATDILPKDELTQFLIDYDIRDLKPKLKAAKLQFKHLECMEVAHLNELCAQLQLSITEKMRFTYAVKDVLKDRNGAMYPMMAAPRRQCSVDLMQSQSTVYSPPEALLSDDEYYEPYAMRTNKVSHSKRYKGSNSKSDALHNIKRRNHGLKSSQTYANPN